MCPLCAAGVSTWLLAGGAGGGALLTAAYAVAKSRVKKTLPGDKSPQTPIKNLPKD